MGEPQKFKIIDNPFVAETYANKLIAASFDGGAVVITLGAMRFEHGAGTLEESSPLPVHVTSRLALSPSGAIELANALNKMLNTVSQIQQKAATATSAEASQANSAATPRATSKSSERREP